VVVRVAKDEFLYLAHLKNESVAVKVGDEVSAGDKLGECGNSGRSLLPHLHIHLQNSGDFPVAESLPLEFSNYIADGEPVAEGMPLGSANRADPLGQRVKNQ
jgi:murein DD-endopeptidase MepM/ murein hydrolase activator NlpD